VGIAALIAAVTLPVLFVLLRDTPSTLGLPIDGEASAAAQKAAIDQHGMTLREALASRQYRLMALTFFVFGLSLQGAQLGAQALMLMLMLMLMLISVIFGRLSSGFLLDRFFAPRVAQGFALAPIIGIAALALGATGTSAVTSAMCIGLAVGGESDVIAYLVRRYFGLRQYSRIYGTFFSFFGVGSALVPRRLAAAPGIAVVRISELRTRLSRERFRSAAVKSASAYRRQLMKAAPADAAGTATA
jgi:MFS transporter, OFA family, oxalate/formate antiporter